MSGAFAGSDSKGHIMNERVVNHEVKGGIGRITVMRPKALNALNKQVLEELSEAFAQLVADDLVQVILLRGEGDRAFIAGADITEFVGATPRDALAIANRIRALTTVITECPKPVIAVIDGFALGGGFELALACDIRLASNTAKFGLPEIKLGILPGGGGTVRLTQLVGSSMAKQLTMTGEPITADRAFGLGLVASLHASHELEAAATHLAEKICALPKFALAQLKQVVNAAVDAPTSVALDNEIRAFALCFDHPDQHEGAQAFLEKRPANFLR